MPKGFLVTLVNAFAIGSRNFADGWGVGEGSGLGEAVMGCGDGVGEVVFAHPAAKNAPKIRINTFFICYNCTMQLSETRKGELAILGEAVLWSLFPIIVILALSTISPMAALAWSTLFASLFRSEE